MCALLLDLGSLFRFDFSKTLAQQHLLLSPQSHLSKLTWIKPTKKKLFLCNNNKKDYTPILRKTLTSRLELGDAHTVTVTLFLSSRVMSLGFSSLFL